MSERERELEAMSERELIPFRGEALVEEAWPLWSANWYRDEQTGEWIYKFADQRIVAAERSEPPLSGYPQEQQR